MYREHKNTVDIAPRQKEAKFTRRLPVFTLAWQGNNRMVDDDVGAMNSCGGVAFSSIASSGVDKVQYVGYYLLIIYSVDVDFNKSLIGAYLGQQ